MTEWLPQFARRPLTQVCSGHPVWPLEIPAACVVDHCVHSELVECTFQALDITIEEYFIECGDGPVYEDLHSTFRPHVALIQQLVGGVRG